MLKQQLFESIDILGSPYESFLFDTDKYQLPTMPHWHYFMEILYIIDGTVLIDCYDMDHYLKAGDMILFFPRVMHSIYAATQERIQYYVLKFDVNRLDSESFSIPKISIMLENARRNKNIPICLTKETIKSIPFAAYFSTCMEEMQQKDYVFDLIVCSATYRILAEIIRYWKRIGFDVASSVSLDKDIHSIDTILEYIDDHATEHLQVRNLAAMCNISYSFFAKKFKELYGHSCKEYIEFIRVCKAETFLLSSNCDLNYVSQETGFSDCSHLIKMFKKWKGITPKQYALQFYKNSKS